MRYYITSHMKNGDKWVTIRDSFEEMNTVIECIVKDKEVLKFTVEEKLNDHEEKDDLNRQITNLRIKQRELEKENIKLVAQLENDEHNVGHLDEKMKRLDYLEKVFASNRYVFTDIPNTPEN